MNTIWKNVIKMMSLAILIVISFLSGILYIEMVPNQYADTFLAEFEDKYNLLNDTNEKKIVFIGGSSLPFGLRSDLIEQEIEGYKVVNYGLYATLGTKYMMDTSKSNINNGDIIILSPELNAQTYSLYFNPNAILKATDGFSSMNNKLPISDKLKLFYNYFEYAKEKVSLSKEDTNASDIGIYRHDSFNKYGDISVDRPYNIMNNGYDSTMSITMDDKLLNSDFIKYLNKYCDYAKNRGATVYFSFSPCNELAILSSKNTRDLFQEKLSKKIACELLLNLEETIMDYRYFYDTNFHLNSSGAIEYTRKLIKNINSKLGHEGSSQIYEEVPPPEIKGEEIIEPINNGVVDFDLYNGEANNYFQDYFTYRQYGTSYQIVGIKDEYKAVEKIILPSTYNGKYVTAIKEDAFYGCVNLKEIYIGLTYKTLDKKIFNGCIALEKIYLFETDGNKIVPASSDLLTGASNKVKLYIPKGSNYFVGYTWSNYSSYFMYFERGGN